MIRPKLLIQKKVMLDSKGHFRFYPPTYDRSNPKFKPKNIVISLDPRDQYNSKGQLYPKVNLKTEKQLVTMLYNLWGAGDYYISAAVKGREGFFTFWRGEITDDGWIFNVKNFKDNDVKQIENEMIKSQDEEEKQTLQEDLDFFKDMAKEENKGKRYGFAPFLRGSGKRGVWHAWDEPDDGFQEKFKELNKQPRIKTDSTKELSIDEMNNW